MPTGRQELLPSTVKRRKISQFGHVCRHDTLPKITLQGPVGGSLRRVRSRKSWNDGIKEWTGQSISSLLRIANDRGRWTVIAEDAFVGAPQRCLGATGNKWIVNIRVGWKICPAHRRSLCHNLQDFLLTTRAPIVILLLSSGWVDGWMGDDSDDTECCRSDIMAAFTSVGTKVSTRVSIDMKSIDSGDIFEIYLSIYLFFECHVVLSSRGLRNQTRCDVSGNRHSEDSQIWNVSDRQTAPNLWTATDRR